MENLQDPARRVPDPGQSVQPNPPVPPPVPPVNNPQTQPAPNPVYQQPTQQTVYQQPQQPYQQTTYQQTYQPYQQPINQQYYQQQQNYRQNNTEKLYPPVKMGEWMWTMFVAFIPIVGFILLLVWAFSSTTNPSKASWAKATLLWGIIITIIYVII